MAAKKMTVRDAYSKAKKQGQGKAAPKGALQQRGVKGPYRPQNPSSRNKVGVKPKNKKGPADDIGRFVKGFLGQGVKTAKGIKDTAYSVLGGPEVERIVKGKGSKSDYGWTALNVLPVGKIGKIGAKGTAKLGRAVAENVFESAVKTGAKTAAEKTVTKAAKKAVKAADKQTVKAIGKPAAKAAKKESAKASKVPIAVRQQRARVAKEAKRKTPMAEIKPKKPSAAVVDTQDAARKRIQASEKKMAEMRKSGKHVKDGELVGEYKRLDAEILSLRKKVLSSTPKREPRKGNPVTNFRMKAVRREGTDKRLAESIEGGLVNKRTGEIRRVHEEVERRPSKKGALQKEGKTELQLDKANVRAGRDQQDDILLGKRRGLTNEKNVIKGWKAQEKNAISNLKRLERRLNQANLTPKQKASAMRAQTRNRIELRNIRSELSKQAKQSYRTDTENLGRRSRSR